MKKRLLIGALMMALILLLAACSCNHKWQAATCDAPKTCSTCKITEGEALDHDWQEATTDAPKTCSRCKLTEGERIITDPRFTTQSTQFLHGTWTCDVNMTDAMMGLDGGFPNGIDCVMSLEFGNAGDMVIRIAIKDEETFMADYKAYTLELLYASLAQQGISKENADQAMLQAYGLTAKEYVEAALKTYDIAKMFDALGAREVYYVADGKIYAALSWNSQLFEPSAYTLKDGILTIESVTLGDSSEPLQWKKAT